MAPEQAAGGTATSARPPTSTRLGAILYECSPAGRRSAGDRRWRRSTGARPREPVAAARARSRGVPRDLETICLKCLQKEPGPALRHRRRPGRRPAPVPRRRADPGPARGPVERPGAGARAARPAAALVGLLAWRWRRRRRHCLEVPRGRSPAGRGRVPTRTGRVPCPRTRPGVGGIRPQLRPGPRRGGPLPGRRQR